MDNYKQALDFFKFSSKRNWTRAFYDFDIAGYEGLLRTAGEEFWNRAGFERALGIFRSAANRVPAYKNFLKSYGVKAELVRSLEDFFKVPFTDKENYIKKYPLEERCWDGDLSKSGLAAVSSGTSGEPVFWPRGGFQEFEAAVTHELLYRYLFEIDKYKTIVIIGFPMGVYISGVATLLPSWFVSQKKDYKMTVVGAGNNKQEVLRAVKNLRDSYEQVILAGHPFFIKDVIESGRDEGVLWDGRRLGMMFCSEGVNEDWRKFVMEQTGVSRGRVIINTYGSSEMLLMGYETPISISLRGFLPDPEAVCFQYNPFLRYIEEANGEFLFTAASGVPLVRFNLRDSGRIISFKEGAGLAGGSDIMEPLWNLPFFVLSGRSDQTLVFYAANIYPEHIRSALQSKRFLGLITGRFVMSKGYLDNRDEFLEINIELAQGVLSSEEVSSAARDHIVQHLRRVNMEYFDASSRLSNKNLTPRVVLCPYQSEKYFKPGLKPKYIRAVS